MTPPTQQRWREALLVYLSRLLIAPAGQVSHPAPWLIRRDVAIATKVLLQSWTSASPPGSLGPPHNYASALPVCLSGAVFPTRRGMLEWLTGTRTGDGYGCTLQPGEDQFWFFVTGEWNMLRQKQESINKLSDGGTMLWCCDCQQLFKRGFWPRMRWTKQVIVAPRGSQPFKDLSNPDLILFTSTANNLTGSWAAAQKLADTNKFLPAPCCGTPATSNG